MSSVISNYSYSSSGTNPEQKLPVEPGSPIEPEQPVVVPTQLDSHHKMLNEASAFLPHVELLRSHLAGYEGKAKGIWKQRSNALGTTTSVNLSSSFLVYCVPVSYLTSDVKRIPLALHVCTWLAQVGAEQNPYLLFMYLPKSQGISLLPMM